MITAERILIYRLGSLGDTIMALPSLHLIRRMFPAAQITILTNRPVAAKAAPLSDVLGEESELFDAVMDYPVELRAPAEIRKLRERIRAGKFDLLIHLSAPRGWLNSARDYFFFRACGIPRIIGVPFARRDLQVVRTSDGLHEWEPKRLARRLQKLGGVELEDSCSWDLRLTAAERAEADELLRVSSISTPFVAMSLGTKLVVKDWSLENWSKLLEKLGASFAALPLVALGAPDERAAVDAALAHWPGPSANLCGATSPRVSAVILQRAALFIGHDSGPMHLAAAGGTPCVAIFSGHAPRGQWFPRGRNNTILIPDERCATCSASTCRQVNGTCILSITVDQVRAAVVEKLTSAVAVR
jgi:ADP-heptose:LPS heptosyltransferase